MKIVKEQGYHGYILVENLLMNGRSYNPFTLLLQLIKELEDAKKVVF
jgi:hypothetical protein